MDTQLTGYDTTLSNLFTFRTENLSFSIKGKFVHVKVSDDKDSSAIGIKTALKYQSFISSIADNGQITEISYTNNTMISPLFFEWVDYEIVMVANDDETYELNFGGESNILSKLNNDKYNQVYTGLINFHDSIGYSDLIMYRNGEKYFSITIEVYPQKLSYKKDYEELKNDVSSILYNLIYSVLEKTFSNMILKDTNDPSPTETLSILLAIYKRFRSALDLIIAKPHHQLISTEKLMRAEKVQKISNSTIKWIEKHPEQVSFQNGHIVNADKVTTTRKIVIFDTKENRYAKHIVNETLALITRLTDKWIKYANTVNRDKDGYYQSILDNMKKELRMRLETSFFKHVEEEYAFNSMSLVFSMAPGYKDLFKYYLMLKMGLSENLRIDDLIFNLSLKGVSKLYEYWCFIKLNNIISSRYDWITKEGKIKTDKRGLFYELVKGKTGSSIIYETKDNSIKMKLEYNPTNESTSVNQIPDNVFSLTRTESGNAELEWEFIFDAKYRIAKNKKGPFTYSAEDEDINVMHRYRDSILSISNNIESNDFKIPRKRKVVGAFVLYPYPDSEKEYSEGKLDSNGNLVQHPNYSSIIDQNIGAFPFLPGHTELLSRFLDQIVIESPLETLSRTPLPAGFDYMVTYSDHNQNMLVVFLDDIDTITQEDWIEYIPGSYVSLPFNAEVLQKNPNTRFNTYLIVSCNTGKYYIGSITKCLASKNENIWYRFIFDTQNSTGKLEKRGRKNKPNAFSSSNLILSCSDTIGDLKKNSLAEYNLNYAKKKLHSGIFKDESNLPEYFIATDDGTIDTEWPIIYDMKRKDQ